MNQIDRTLLEFCREAFRPLKPLRGQIPSGTLYRHVGRLEELGWLEKNGAFYRTTEAGLRQLAEATSGRRWDGLERLYPPLRLVPTPVHQAMIELILAAVVARQHETRPDRHPFFVIFGGTLHWKTSLGTFLCHVLGLDPACHVVECGTESGKSLAFRRGGTGTLVFKRELLNAPFLVLDEFLGADASVRATLGLFLSGRLVVPVENEQLTVRPVPLLTLNPRDKATLEGRIGLSAPQIRRALLANVDAIPMPDLATSGEQAIAAARDHPPLAISAPVGDCQAHHRAIVELTRAILLPEAYERVDVEVVVNLCTGMTAFLPEPGDAIPHVIHALGVLAETLGWTRPGWIEVVLQFTLGPPAPRPPSPTPALSPGGAMPGGTLPVPREREPVAATAVSLQVPRPGRREAQVPDLSLSEGLRGRLIWLAVDTGRSLEEGLTVLLNMYVKWRTDKDTLARLEKILTLAEELEIQQVEIKTLQEYLEAEATLAEHHCTLADVPEALKLIDLLDEVSTEWDWARARTLIQALRALLNAGIEPKEVVTFLARHRRLCELDFREELAEAVVELLAQAGATGDRREAILRELVALAGSLVDRAEVEQARDRLKAEVAALTADRDWHRRMLKAHRTWLKHLLQQEANARQCKARLDAECAAQNSELAVLNGFRALLLEKIDAMDPFFADLERLARLRKEGARTKPEVWVTLLPGLRQKIVLFLTQLGKAAETVSS